MSTNECNAIIDSYNEQYKNGWEMARYIAYVVAAVNTKQIKKPQDLVKFEWDTEIPVEIISKEERMRQEQEMLDIINRKGLIK